MVRVQAPEDEDLSPVSCRLSAVRLLQVLGCSPVVVGEVLEEPVDEAWVLLQLGQYDLQREDFLDWLLLGLGVLVVGVLRVSR